MDEAVIVLLSAGLIGMLVGGAGVWIWLSEKLIDQDIMIDHTKALRNQVQSLEGRLALSQYQLRNAEEIINELTVKARTQ